MSHFLSLSSSFSTFITSTSPIMLVLASVGALSLLSYLGSLGRLAFNLTFRPNLSLSKYGAANGAWAMITGASDGIGKEFALQLAKAQFNVILLARTEVKLSNLAQEIRELNNVKVLVIPFDFNTQAMTEYNQLKKQLMGLDIRVLVNNVGTNHDIPTPFLEEDIHVVNQIINVNIASILHVTHMVAPKMVERKNGLIINVGSFAGLLPQPLLSVYSGSKSFLLTWSQALGRELKGSGVNVQCLSTYFVVSNMSKIRKPSLMIPTAKQYVSRTLKSLGNPGGASTPFTSSPYPMHAILNWVLDHVGTPTLWINYVYSVQLNIRHRALFKQQQKLKSGGDKKEE